MVRLTVWIYESMLVAENDGSYWRHIISLSLLPVEWDAEWNENMWWCSMFINERCYYFHKFLQIVSEFMFANYIVRLRHYLRLWCFMMFFCILEVFFKAESWGIKCQERFRVCLERQVLKAVVLFRVTVIYQRPEIILATFQLVLASDRFYKEVTWHITMCSLKTHLECCLEHNMCLNLLLR